MKSQLIEKTLMLGKTEGKKRREQQRMRSLGSITDSKDMNLSTLQETLEDGAAGHAVVRGESGKPSQQGAGHDSVTE